MMPRSLAIAAVLLLGLAGCSAPPVPADLAPEFGEVKARFVTGRDVDVIEIRALDAQPIRMATLVMPDGSQVPAEEIQTTTNPSQTNLATRDPAISTGAGFAAPTGPFFGPGVERSTTTLVGQIASVALIRLPEASAYRKAWQAASIEVAMGDGAARRTERLTAPPPP
jgi:hypothetical protein